MQSLLKYLYRWRQYKYQDASIRIRSEDFHGAFYIYIKEDAGSFGEIGLYEFRWGAVEIAKILFVLQKCALLD